MGKDYDLEELVNYLEDYVEDYDYAGTQTTSSTTLSLRFRHYCISASVIAFGFFLTLAASLALPKGILRLIIQLKSICLILASTFCILAEVTTEQMGEDFIRDILKQLESKEDDQAPCATYEGQ